MHPVALSILPKTYCDSFSLPPPSLAHTHAHLFSEVLLDEVEGLQPRPLMCFEPLLLQVRLLLWVVDGKRREKTVAADERGQVQPAALIRHAPLEDRLHDLDAVDRAEL
jgi:hypothetical protein